MKAIQRYVDLMTEEIESAKDYAESYLSCKSKGNTKWSTRFHDMAEDELRHANFIHEKAVEEITELKRVYTPPVEMEEVWEKSHKAFVEKCAWIMQMLSM